jgi:type I restriction enzyme, S subunit
VALEVDHADPAAVGAPEGWEVRPLGDLLQLRNGVNADKSAYGRGTRFINVLEVIMNTHLRAVDVPGRVSLENSLIESYRVQRGDILFNRTSETQQEVGLASVYVDDEPVVFGGFVIRGRPFPQSDWEHAYSGYGLRAPSVRRQIIARGQGAIRANIGQAELRTVLFSKPRLRSEQRAIATALSDVDLLIGLLDRLIVKKRDLKQAAMQQLLTAETRLPGFNKRWKTWKLGAFAPMQRGFDLPHSQVRTGPYPVVYSNGILNHHHEFKVRGPGVVTGRSGTIGTVSFISGDYWPHNTSLWVTNFAEGSPKFVFYLLSALRLERFATGSGVPTLNRNDVHDFSMALPSCLKEQEAIAAVLSDIDIDIKAIEDRREKTRLMKQGMMQELLTGRTRLV